MSENDNLQPQANDQSSAQATDPAFCKYCGSRVYRSTPFCPSCGKPLQKAAPQQPQPQQQQQFQQPQQPQQFQQAQQFQQPQQYQQPQQFQQPQQSYYTPFQQGQPLQVTDVTKYHLLGAAKWIKVSAIIACIFFALFLIGFFVTISKLPYVPGEVLVILIPLILSLYPIVKSFSFSSHAQMAVESGDSNELQESMSDLRGMATYNGILAIIVAIFLLISIIVGISEASHVRSSYYY